MECIDVGYGQSHQKGSQLSYMLCMQIIQRSIHGIFSDNDFWKSLSLKLLELLQLLIPRWTNAMIKYQALLYVQEL